MVLLFKRATLIMLVLVIVILAVLGATMLVKRLSVNEVMITGNYHLDEEDIINSSGIKKGEPLLKVNFEKVDKNLRQNAWIKNVSVRKQLPGTVLINIEEAVPTALLRIKKRLYLIDRGGYVLERIEGETTPFLPVLKGINRNNKKGMAEALKLVGALSEKNTLANRESIEVGLESYGLTMNIDGEFIKIGYGDYSEKFDRWIELEPELRRKGLPIKYVDLRFKDSVVVKPLEPVKRKKTS